MSVCSSLKTTTFSWTLQYMTLPDSAARMKSPSLVTMAWVTIAPRAESASLDLNEVTVKGSLQPFWVLGERVEMPEFSREEVPDADAVPGDGDGDAQLCADAHGVDLELVAVDVVDLF